MLAIVRALWSRTGVYVMAGAGVLLALAYLAASISGAATTKEKLRNAQAELKRNKRDQRIEADTRAISAAAARRKLYDRWGRR